MSLTFNMGKVIYVNGSIVIKTRYFVPKELGCLYEVAPDGAEIIEPTNIEDGVKCLLIDEDNPQSLFNEYYAKGDVSADRIATSYFSASYLDCIHEYKRRIEETCKVIKKVENWESKEQALVYKMAYVNILTCLDAFICYVILRRSVQDEHLFDAVMYDMAPNNKCDYWNKLKDKGQIGEWEQDAIKFVLSQSFINTRKIDSTISLVGLGHLKYNRGKFEEYFRIRHLIVHRSGKKRDDNEVIITYKLLTDVINECHDLVGAIFDTLCLTISEEMKNKSKESDIEGIFPGGIVKPPYKLSDIARLLRSGESKTEFEPIELPNL